jgi:hypothetical protein
VDGVWAAIATHVAEPELPRSRITESDISLLLRVARPYVLVDREAGQTVYRLSHNAFVEHLIDSQPHRTIRQWQRRVTAGLARLAESCEGGLNPYIASYLSGHAVEGQALQVLADCPNVLDRLDPVRVSADGLRVLVVPGELPAAVAAVLAGRGVLASFRRTRRSPWHQTSCTTQVCQAHD